MQFFTHGQWPDALLIVVIVWLTGGWLAAIGACRQGRNDFVWFCLGPIGPAIVIAKYTSRAVLAGWHAVVRRV